MKPIYLYTLIACASLSLGVAGVSIWQGGPGTTEKITAALVLAVVGWTVRKVWRDAGPEWQK